MSNAEKLSIDELKRVLSYDPATGVFTWIAPRAKRLAGKPAGSIANTGYVAINPSKAVGPVLAHRLAWFYMTGEWPKQHIDHINRVRTDNRFCNLRDASVMVNVQNIVAPNKNNALGVRGVAPHRGRFRARIYTQGKTHNLGVFDAIESAAAAYQQAKSTLHQGCTP